MRQLHTVLLLSLLLLLLAVLPLGTHAQTAPDLIVTLRDGAGAGIVNATITVRDRDGDGVLAQAQTDANGTATIASVAMSDVRVAVAGKGSGGMPLKQLATDSGGIALFLDGARTTQLDLRVEDDGTVIPDPQTMLVPEVVPPTATTPMLTVVTPISDGVFATAQPTASLLVMASPAPASAVAPTVSDESSPFSKFVVGFIVSMVVTTVVLQLGLKMWRERRSR